MSRRGSTAPRQFRSIFRIYLRSWARHGRGRHLCAILLAWNEYLYQFLLLSNDRSMTVA